MNGCALTCQKGLGNRKGVMLLQLVFLVVLEFELKEQILFLNNTDVLLKYGTWGKRPSDLG